MCWCWASAAAGATIGGVVVIMLIGIGAAILGKALRQADIDLE